MRRRAAGATPCAHASHRLPPRRRLDSALEAAREAGLRLTAPRREILAVVAAASTPLSSEDVHARLPKSDLVTVYRNLSILERAEVFRRADMGDGVRRYELSSGEHHHHYVVCRGCGRTEPFDGCPFAAVNQTLSKKGFTKIQHTLEVYALCDACRDKESA